MRLLTFLKFMRQILRDGPADLDWIQRQGLLAVKLSQIFALRPDLLSMEKCKQLQTLYRNAHTIDSEDVWSIIENRGNSELLEKIEWFDTEPLAAASVGQVHRARLNSGDEVVVKVVKGEHKKKFIKDVRRMKNWLRVFLFFSRKLRKVGNPLSLLNHVEDYTTRELDLRNEIQGGNELMRTQ